VLEAGEQIRSEYAGTAIAQFAALMQALLAVEAGDMGKALKASVR